MFKLSNNLSVLISRRRWSKRILKKILPEVVYEKILNGHITFHFDPRDLRGPSFHFAYDLEKGFNNYEESSKRELLRHIPKDGVFYDIGANIGMFSAYIAHKRPDVTFICFEPEKQAFYCLSKTMSSIDNLSAKLFNVGVGERNEELPIYKSDRNDGGHSMVENWSEHGQQKTSDFVSVINLDDFIIKQSISPPDVIKIDVEGFELNVLKGIKNTIEKYRPIVLIETNNEDIVNSGEFIKYLNNLDDLKVFFSTPKNSVVRPLSELVSLSQSSLNRGEKLSNIIYYFK